MIRTDKQSGIPRHSSNDISVEKYFVDTTSSQTFYRKFFVERHFVDKISFRNISSKVNYFLIIFHTIIGQI